LAEIAAIDDSMRGLSDRLNEVVFLLEDIAVESRAYRDRIEADPERLAAVEERLDVLKSLRRKYGPTIDDVIQFGETAASELAELTGEGVDLETLQERERRLSEEIGREAAELSRRRLAAAASLAAEVETAMAELNMGRALFRVDFQHQEAASGVPVALNGTEPRTFAVDATGIDQVEFLIAPNAGEALKPLGRIASGGETARLMLALKSILSNADATPTLIFDEVDVGVGGRSGQVVGEKLWRLATTHQVLVITHLPQIAAFAGSHFRITKGERDGRVVSRVEPITGETRIDELAAMLDGLPVTPASRQSASEMLERVREWTTHDGAGQPAVSARSG
jgi:DNA repair protein RecN (Recombination protein N)